MKRVLIVGCPRSGTSWLQLLIAQHPHVATTQETHLFDMYLNHIERIWTGHKTWNAGMVQLFSEPEFYAFWAKFADDVFDRIGLLNPSATVILEKTPAHVRHAPLIMKLCPDVHFIHLIRDPRSVVSSLCAAGRTWGAKWASTKVLENARVWRSDVLAGREIRTLTRQYTELRYEDMNGDRGPGVLRDLFEWMGLDADSGFCKEILEKCRLDRLRSGAPDLRASRMLKRIPAFYRTGMNDGWRQDLTPRAVRAVEYVNADLMETLGYRSDERPAAHKPLALMAAEFAYGVEWRLRRGLDLAFGRLRQPG